MVFQKLITYGLLFFLAATSSNINMNRLLADYSYSNGGSDWTDICKSGNEQSPIDISSVKGTCDNSMVFDLKFTEIDINAELVNTGDTLRLVPDTDNYLSQLYATDINGKLFGYTGTQMLFHAPSEHKIGGDRYAAELHIVHEIKDEFKEDSTDGRTYAAVALLFEVNDGAGDNALLKALNLATPGNLTLNMKTLLESQFPANTTYFTYKGSFTVPPCTQLVNWYVVEQIFSISSSQLATLTTYWSGNSTFASGRGNNREIQDLNERVIKKGGIVCEAQFVYFFSFFILFIFIGYFVFKLL